MPTVVIIGNRADAHAKAVLDALSQYDVSVSILDLETLPQLDYEWSDQGFRTRQNASEKWRSWEDGTRGWIRRISPPFWQAGIAIESVEAAETTAWLALLGGIARTAPVRWLTPIDPLLVSENKLLQSSTARTLGISYPRTVVTSERNVVDESLEFPVVLKPLGPSHFFGEKGAHIVYAQEALADSDALLHLSGAPFIVQERLQAVRHWRLVTVARQSWGAYLDASDRPLDWRADATAHHSFNTGRVPDQIASGALAVASALGLGYSSQDWVETADDYYLLDVNPGGQWLFLPEPVATDVTSRIASWLARRDD